MVLAGPNDGNNGAGPPLNLAVTDLGNGQYTAQYTPTKSGSDNITVSLNNGLAGAGNSGPE